MTPRSAPPRIFTLARKVTYTEFARVMAHSLAEAKREARPVKVTDRKATRWTQVGQPKDHGHAG